MNPRLNDVRRGGDLTAHLERRRLIVLDAHAHAHRAFHALDPMSAPDGLPTNALYGFAGLLKRVVVDDRPDYLAVVFDAPDDRRTTFRTAIYPAYKAQRPPRAPALAAQMPLLRDIARAFNAPVLEDEGFEADDLIASVVALAEARDVKTLVQSGDKDLLQLASPRTTLWDAMRGRHYAPAAVEEKLGVPPAAVADFLALCGDASDNVPGVPGVGPKTAAALLRAWGSLDGIYGALETLPPRERQRLETHRELAYLSRSLTRLRSDVPIGGDLEAFALRPPDYDLVETLFERLGFRSLIPPRRKHITSPQPAAPAGRLAKPSHALEVITRPSDWARVLAAVERSPLVGLALGPRSVGLAPLSGEAFEVMLETPGAAQRSLFDEPLGLPSAEVFAALSRLLATPGRVAIAVDSLAIARKLTLPRVDFDPIVARRLLGHPAPELASPGEAARAALRERSTLLAELQQAGLDWLYREVELPLLQVLAAIENAGPPLDAAALERARLAFDADRKALEAEIHGLAGRRFRIDDPRQLAEILYGVLGLPAFKRGKRAKNPDAGGSRASVDASALGELARAHPLPAAVLALQRLKRVEKDCLHPLATHAHNASADRPPRCPTRHDPLGPSGRIAVDGPLPIWLGALRDGPPAEHERLFPIVRNAHLCSIDLAQLDLRVAAHCSDDPALVTAVREDDPYETLGRAWLDHVGSPRRRAIVKSLALGLLYGTSAAEIARATDLSIREVRELVTRRDTAHEALVAWVGDVVQSARQAGFVRSLLGRKRLLPELQDERPSLQKLGEGLAVTSTIAGSAADIQKLVLVRLHTALGGRGRLVAALGDLALVETEPGMEDDIAACARTVAAAVTAELGLRVPIVTSTGPFRPFRPATTGTTGEPARHGARSG